MRHRVNTIKLGRKSQHRDAMIANLACSLIIHNRITTTLAKAKALRPFAEKLVTIGKKGTIAGRRLAFSRLKSKDIVKKLFDSVAPKFATRNGGYTRILKLGKRHSDAAEMAIIEWVEGTVAAQESGASSDKSAEPTKAVAETAEASKE